MPNENHALHDDWAEAHRAALDDDLSRILLGESPLWRQEVEAPPRDFRDLLRRARPLVDELSSYVWQECDDGDDFAGPRATPPVARRIGELAEALTNLFDASAEAPANG